MIDTPPQTPSPISLEQLLTRDDTWVGDLRRFVTKATLGTGFKELNSCLMNQGWPLGSLVEVCQAGMQAEWQLFMPALQQMSGLIVLLNPPAIPFCQALLQAGIDLERLVIVSTVNKMQFIASLTELARASVGVVLAWQPKDYLNYTELRKCTLATSEGNGLYVIFRAAENQQQNSPAALRLFSQLTPQGLEIKVFKQRGYLQKQQPRPVLIALPSSWQSSLPYYALNQGASVYQRTLRPSTSIMSLRGKS